MPKRPHDQISDPTKVEVQKAHENTVGIIGATKRDLQGPTYIPSKRFAPIVLHLQQLTPEHFQIIKQGDVETAKTFLNPDNINATDSNGYSVLHYSILGGAMMTHFVLGKGADVTQLSIYSESALLIAIKNQRHQAITALLARGALPGQSEIQAAHEHMPEIIDDLTAQMYTTRALQAWQRYP